MKPAESSNTTSAPHPPPLSRSLWWLWLAGFTPLLAITLLAIWLSPWPLRWQVTATLLSLVVTISTSQLATRSVLSRLRTITNLLDGLREGEYTLRAVEPLSSTHSDDPLTSLVRSANRLSEAMRHRRWSARETAALLNILLERLDAAVLLIDNTNHLVTANPAASTLLGSRQQDLINKSCQAVGLRPFIEAPPGSVIDHAFAARSGRWEVRRATVRLDGREHLLLVISDLTRPLREEERRAWERLVQVLRHEVNNSLAPITSLADSLARRVEHASAASAAMSEESRELLSDLGQGLSVIASRSGSLTRFLAAYTRLSRLPEPSLRAQPVGPLLRRIAALQTTVPVAVPPDDGPAVLIDAAQIEQAILNLITNAAEATLERWPADAALPAITIEHRQAESEPGFLEVRIIDEGVGKPDSENLFVPFFTTKPTGTGIGLVLSRRIIEAHGGRLSLEPRQDALGCIASLTLRLSEAAAQEPSAEPSSSGGQTPSAAEGSAAPAR